MNPLLDLSARPVIAHRGASGLAPENTLAALDLAVAQGADALEFDLRLASCGTPVVFHDASLDRTTNAAGPLGAHSASALSNLDAGCHFSPDGGATFPYRERRLGVPTLAQVLERFPDSPLLIELKTVEVAAPALEVLTRHGAADRAVVASFLDEALAPYRRVCFPTGASRRRIAWHWLRTSCRLPAGGCPDLLYAVPDRFRDRIEVPTRRFVAAARRLGRPVHVWTVNDPARAAQLWGIGVSGIITNFPALMLAERARLPRISP
jgi:glycerophosphoryl diester phosphodiesterase